MARILPTIYGTPAQVALELHSQHIGSRAEDVPVHFYDTLRAMDAADRGEGFDEASWNQQHPVPTSGS